MEYTQEAIRSVATIHFTGALAAGASEHEDLQFPDGWGLVQIQKILIHNVSLTIDATNTTEVVPFYINFWGTDGGADANPDVDDWQGRIEFAEDDLEQLASAGLFRATRSLADNPLHYIDKDSTGELHVSIENTDATKAWHADDEIQITFMVTPVL